MQQAPTRETEQAHLKTSGNNETRCSTSYRNADLTAQRQAGRSACEKAR